MVSKSILAVAAIILVLAIGGIYFIQQPYTPSETPTPTSTLTSPSPTVTSKKATTPPTYWPTEGWRTSTPEQQGMDSEKLVEMFEFIEQYNYKVDSILVIRNGHMVLETYAHPFGPGKKHVIHSCSKSVTSSLVGIAIDEGYLESVEKPVLDIFPERSVANLDANKEAMTVEHLLTMTAGLESHDSYLYGWSGLLKMIESEDWVQFVLDLPMAEKSGTRFEYCNGATFLLSAIIQQTTGVTAYEFAKGHLFYPLGITDVYWPSNPQGITYGFGELRIRPSDMAKIGYLYLNNGMWEDKQIISSEWIEASTRKHVSATLQDGYGYQWWIDSSGNYMALGYGWQYLHVVPEQNLVVVFTSNLYESMDTDSKTLLNMFIIPAAISDEALPENPETLEKLRALIDEFEKPPVPKPVPPLPEIAYNISGKTYELENNNHNITSFSLTFEEEEAIIEVTYVGGIQLVLYIGLDDVPRINDHGELGVWAVKGNWKNEDTFEIIQQLVGDHLTITKSGSFQNGEISIIMYDTYSFLTLNFETITSKQK